MTHVPLDALPVSPRIGEEPFTSQGQEIGVRLSEFWSWACSDLASNAMLGILAEYIVGLALGCVDATVRTEWDTHDLRTLQGHTVQVKSTAYLQSWQQAKLSKVQFSIRPTAGWDAKTNTLAEERKRQADVYVFCVLKHQDKESLDPLNLDQWDFYVLSTKRLNAVVGDQKTITLGSLLKCNPAAASFASLRACVESAMPE